MFCSTLRRRPSFASAISSLTANPGLNLRENSLKTHDLAIHLPHQGRSETSRILRVLLLSPTSTSPDTFPATIERIQHFAALNGGLDSIIIFLLSNDCTVDQSGNLHAYTHLSATLLRDPSTASIKLLQLIDTILLESLLKSYITSNSAGRAAQMVQARRQDAFNTALDLVPWCIAREKTKPLDSSVPLDEDQVNLLTDLFGSLKEFAEVSVVDQSQGRVEAKVEAMKTLLGENVTQDVLDFWRQEWYAD